MRRSRSVQFAGGLLSIVLLAAACGNDADEKSVDSADESGSTSLPTTSMPATPATDADDDTPVEVSPDGQCGSPNGTLESAADAPAAGGTGLDSMERSGDPDLFPGFGEVTIAVVAPDGTTTGWCVLLAETARQRTQGLMEVTDLGGYTGMLFVDDVEDGQSFWMKNTVMPLSIAWFDNEGAFVSATDMEPCEADPCDSYPSEGPARFALEVPQGKLGDLGIDEDATLRIGAV